METVGEPVPEPAPPGKHFGTRLDHGLATPEGTPGPDAARLDADEKRHQEEAQGAGQTPSNAGAQQTPEDGSDRAHERADEGNRATPEQIEAVEHVMKCSSTDYRQILGVRNEYADKGEESRDVIAAFKKLGCLTHEKYNGTKDAGEAFRSK